MGQECIVECTKQLRMSQDVQKDQPCTPILCLEISDLLLLETVKPGEPVPGAPDEGGPASPAPALQVRVAELQAAQQHSFKAR